MIQHNVDVRIARIFNTYGPAMAFNDGRVVSNFITQALLGLPVSIYGGGGQTRSFCYVSDLIEGIIALMNCESVDGPVNLGSDNEISVKELAENINDLVGSKSVIEVQNLPEDDPKIRRPDLQKSRTILGWSAEVSLQAGLTRTIQDFKSRLLVNQ